jgi:hypothetical protein
MTERICNKSCLIIALFVSLGLLLKIIRFYDTEIRFYWNRKYFMMLQIFKMNEINVLLYSFTEKFKSNDFIIILNTYINQIESINKFTEQK